MQLNNFILFNSGVSYSSAGSLDRAAEGKGALELKHMQSV